MHVRGAGIREDRTRPTHPRMRDFDYDFCGFRGSMAARMSFT